MSSIFKKFALESESELNVDKVVRVTHEGDEDDYDAIRDEFKPAPEVNDEIDAEVDDPGSADTDTEDSTQNLDENPNEEDISEVDDALGEVGVDPEEDVSVESFLELHKQSIGVYVSVEDIFTKEGAVDAAKWVGNGLWGVMGYLVDLGVAYGPTILKHVFKGILLALGLTLKALSSGAKHIVGYFKKRSESYTNYKSKIEKLKKELNELQLNQMDKDPNSDMDQDQEPLRFEDDVVISSLKIGNNVNFDKTLKVALKFNEDFFSGLHNGVHGGVNNARYLVKSVIHGATILPEKKMVEKLEFPGLIRGKVNGYEPSVDGCDSYVYRNTLPGDVRFIGHIPSKLQNDPTEIRSSYEASSLFFGFDQHEGHGVTGCNYLDPKSLADMLDTMDEICTLGLNTEKIYKEIIVTRNSLKNDFKLYLKHLLTVKHQISVRDSLAEFISLKVAYVDQTFIAGSFRIHDYNAGLLSASLGYVSDAIKALKN